MKFYSVALFVPLILLISIGLAVESFSTKPKKRQALEVIKPEIVYDCNYFQAHRFHDSLNNPLEEYHSISEKQGIQPVEDEIVFNSFIADQKLVKVKTSDYFYLDSFNYSFPVLTPETKDFLDTVGARFNEMIDKTELKGTKLIVTSLTRTTATVKRLVRVNRNASLRSPHLNGNSFDFRFKQRCNNSGVISSIVCISIKIGFRCAPPCGITSETIASISRSADSVEKLLILKFRS